MRPNIYTVVRYIKKSGWVRASMQVSEETDTVGEHSNNIVNDHLPDVLSGFAFNRLAFQPSGYLWRIFIRSSKTLLS